MITTVTVQGRPSWNGTIPTREQACIRGTITAAEEVSGARGSILDIYTIDGDQVRVNRPAPVEVQMAGGVSEADAQRVARIGETVQVLLVRPEPRDDGAYTGETVQIGA